MFCGGTVSFRGWAAPAALGQGKVVATQTACGRCHPPYRMSRSGKGSFTPRKASRWCRGMARRTDRPRRPTGHGGPRYLYRFLASVFQASFDTSTHGSANGPNSMSCHIATQAQFFITYAPRPVPDEILTPQIDHRRVTARWLTAQQPRVKHSTTHDSPLRDRNKARLSLASELRSRTCGHGCANPQKPKSELRHV